MSVTSVLVVTAVDADRAEFLTDTARSIAAQAAAGVQVTWAVRFDGERSLEEASRWAPLLFGVAGPAAEVVVSANGVRRGTAVTRTMAWLSAPRHDWVVSLDADDRFAPGALGALAAGAVSAAEAGVKTGWVSGAAVRFGAAEPAAREDLVGPGPVAAGEVLKLVRSTGVWAPVSPNTLLIAGDLVERFAGWPAFVSCEDLGMLYRVTAVADGWRIGEVVLERRLWDGQVTAAAGWHRRARQECFDAACRLAHR